MDRAEQLHFQRHHRLDVPPAHRANGGDLPLRLHAGSTDFGRPGGEASGRRRYNGSSTSGGASLRTFAATRCAISAADAAASTRVD